MTLTCVDLSHVKAITSWDALCEFADILIFKATEGTGFTDPLFAGRLAEARRRGKLIGVYHYVGSSTARRVFDANAEADYFASRYGWQRGEVPIYDYEPAMPPMDPDGWLAAAMQRSMSRGWPVPMVYMNTSAAASDSWSRVRSLNAALWIARYFANNGAVPAQEPSPGSFGGYAMWQYTSNGAVPGVAGATDVSLFYGTADAWRAIGGARTPLPTQEDGMADMLIAADQRGVARVVGGYYQSLTAAESVVWGKVVGAAPVQLTTQEFDVVVGSLNRMPDFGPLAVIVDQLTHPQDPDNHTLNSDLRNVLADMQQKLSSLQAGGVDITKVIGGVLAGLNGAQLSVQQSPAKS